MIFNYLKRWFLLPDRLTLLHWSAGLFSAGALITIVIALRYFTVYKFPFEPLAIVYTIAAFVSHFASILLIVWLALVLFPILIIPFKKIIIPWCVFLVAVIMTLTLLDSQLYATHRFHFTFLTIKIFGITTWGFGILYLVICTVFTSFSAKLVWNRVIIRKKSIFLAISLPLTIVLLLITHITHIWADANAYIPITRFTATLPLFYPTIDKDRMRKMGFHTRPDHKLLVKHQKRGSDLAYPLDSLSFSDSTLPNILIIAVDAMRYDVMNDTCAPQCMEFARNEGIHFTNHWSGGNSTLMGVFSLFYGLSPTYQKHIESNKISPLFIDRLLSRGYSMGIFTSYRLYSPANLDVTAFVKIPDLRLETKIPGKSLPHRNDSAITEEWKNWLDNQNRDKPIFGFLFYDALCSRDFPENYSNRIPETKDTSAFAEEFRLYKISMLHIDSLIGSVLFDLKGRDLFESTIIVITADHGDEFDDNGIGIKGHGSAFSDYQLRTPLLVFWPGKEPAVIDKRTSHNDIVATLMKNGLRCINECSDYSIGIDLFTDKQWQWLIVGSYYNFAIIEPEQVTVQFPGGYYQVRDHRYRIVSKPVYSRHLTTALKEMGRFYKK